MVAFERWVNEFYGEVSLILGSAYLIIIFFLVMLLLLLSTGTWIGTTLGIIGVVFLCFLLGGEFLQVIGPVLYKAWTNYSLVAIPMFVFMATVLSASGVGIRVYEGAAALFSRFPGGLLHANIMASAAFGAVCGSSTATCATVSQVAIPYMDKEKYPEKLALGSLLAGGGLGLMIPPSAGFIIYGMICEVSVGKLFMAGIIPGIMIAFLFSGYIFIFCKVTKQSIPTYKASFKKTSSALLSTWPIVVLFFTLMSSIFLGICTATEASGVSVFASIIIVIGLKRFNKPMITKALSEALKITVLMFFILGGGFILANSLSNLGVPQALATWVTTAAVSRVQILLLVSVIYLVLGCVFDACAAMVSTLPVLFPVMVAAGFDPIWFGVIMIIYCEMAALTPPIGVNLFVLQGITGKSIERIVRGILPFVFLYLLAIVILYLFPQIALFLPRIMS